MDQTLDFSSYLVGAYHEDDLIVTELQRGCIFFSCLSEDVSKSATPLYASCHYLLLQHFLIFSWRPGFPSPILQIRISSLGSHDTDLRFLSLSMRDLQIFKLSHFSRLNFGITYGFILIDVLFHRK